MGSRWSQCFTASNDFEGSIVPDKDPLAGTSISRRIVHSELSRDFEFTPKVLGTGYSGAVKLAVEKESGRQVAVKQFSKRHLQEHRIKLLQSEVEVYLRLDHPNVCRLLYAYEDKSTVWLVMELCSTELYTKLCARKVYTEGDAAEVMLQMLQAINYLHKHRIVHRDLKLENWMYSAAQPDDRLKLIDFGFSRILHDPDELLDMPCGTLHYTSPEVLARKYTSKCDIWSLGVIGYMLVMGRPPFRGPTNVKTARAILNGEVPKEGRWHTLSSGVRDFLDGMLKKDPQQRMDAAQALAHPWISSSIVPGRCEISVDVLKNLRQFAQGSHLRRAALTLLAYSMTSHELQDVEQAFLDCDKSGHGTISLMQLAEVLNEQSKASTSTEVSSQEVQRIFECLDVSGDDEVQYTPFVAAMLATRVKQHEEKIRATFEAFDKDGSGYITAESLVRIFRGDSGCFSSVLSPSGSSNSVAALSEQGAGKSSKSSLVGEVEVSGGLAREQAESLTREKAEQWIREVDYKGNGVIDYEEFLDALMGKRLWAPAAEDDDDEPSVRVYEDDGHPRGISDFYDPRSQTSWIRYGLASAIIDDCVRDDSPRRLRPQSWSASESHYYVQVRRVSCSVNERYFA